VLRYIRGYTHFPEHGTIYTLHVLSPADLNRQLVKSPTCTVSIPEIELTIPPAKGQLTTVEGLLRDIVADLESDQPLRRIHNEQAHEKIKTIIERCKSVMGDYEDDDDIDDATREQRQREKNDPERKFVPITMALDDPTGNSFIEFMGSTADPRWNMRVYTRMLQQNIDLGLVAPEDVDAVAQPTTAKDGVEALKQVLASKEGKGQGEQEGEGLEGPNEEIYVFPGTCSSCGRPLNTMMKKVNIPYFKVSNQPQLLQTIPRAYFGLPSGIGHHYYVD
jgi:zinc finger protein